MEIQLNGQLTKQDLTQAYKLHFKPSKSSTIFRLTFVVFIITMVIGGIILEPTIFITTSPPMLIPIFVFTAPWLMPYISSFLQWKNQKTLQNDPVSYLITLESVEIKGSNSEGRVKWSGYLKVKQSSDMVLLYQNPNYFNFFPKRLFQSEDDWQKFNNLVKEKISVAPPTNLDKITSISSYTLTVLFIILIIASIGFSLFGSTP